jgi:hypothetical protein
VRGWVIGMLVAVLLTLVIPLLARPGCSMEMCPPTLGPNGQAVTDSFYFARQPLTGNATITVRVTSLSAPGPWSKAGLIIKASTASGSAYAAMMITGSHGVRMEWDYVNDTAGLAGPVSAASPRWLRLTRAGDTISGYDSGDGAHWARVGSAVLSGFPVTAQAGLFAASPGNSHAISGSVAVMGSTQATATFDSVQILDRGRGLSGRLRGEPIDGGSGGFQQAGGRLTVTGSGDIAPGMLDGDGGYDLGKTLGGTFAGLLAVVVVAAMFITAEYRRGLIRLTLTASPRRDRALAAKAIVIGVIAFVTGTAAAALAVSLGVWQLCAAAAILALAIGTVVRRSAIAVTLAIVGIVFPYVLATSVASGFTTWLMRVTPAAGFAIHRAYPEYPQFTGIYTIQDGFFPLSPWAGLAVLCAWAAAALALAGYLLRRRDA